MPFTGNVCIVGNKVLLGEELIPATISVVNGKIQKIHPGVADPSLVPQQDNLIDAADLVLMPGIVDSHVHVNEPGRTEWEGYYTATRAAAAGGVTTLIDMPLNSIPPTTTLKNLLEKHEAAFGKCHIDVGFWGGVVPENEDELVPMIDNGVVGFKCFLIHSGVDEFPSVDEAQVDLALGKMKGTGTVLAFHAEVETGAADDSLGKDPSKYQTFLQSRPPQMELEAIEMVGRLCEKHKDVRCHIVHLSAASALPLIRQIKAKGLPLTVETCPHYLTLKAEDIPEKQTQFKCCPPIRDSRNQDLLWQALKDGDIDLIVSDHSPCTEDLKQPGCKDFMSAWGGISSVQFGLSIIWTEAKTRGFTIADISKLMSQRPAKLAGLDKSKGQIKTGYDADFVLWDPDAAISIEESTIHHRNKLTPYRGRTAYGKIVKTVLKGKVIYNDGEFSEPLGEFLVPNKLEEKILEEIKYVVIAPTP